MRILQIVNTSEASGTTNQVRLLSRALLALGHDVTVLCPDDRELPGQLSADGIPWRAVEFDARGWLDIARTTLPSRGARADILHAHMTRASYCAALIGGLARIPVAATVHNVTHDAAYRRILPRGRNRIVAVSDFVRDMLVSQGIPARFVTRIYNGIDVSAPLASSREIADRRAALCREVAVPMDSELVALFGNLGGPKGHLLLIEAAASITALRPRARILFVGTVPPHIVRETETFASGLGASEAIRFTGYRPDARELLSCVDVVAVPSERETFSLVAAEAGLHGRPVVAARVGGIPEVVIDGVTGILCDRAPKQFAAAIVGLLQNPARRDALGAAGRAHICRSFSTQQLGAATGALYDEMLAER